MCQAYSGCTPSLLRDWCQRGQPKEVEEGEKRRRERERRRGGGKGGWREAEKEREKHRQAPCRLALGLARPSSQK
jgi:hypothetical protein